MERRRLIPVRIFSSDLDGTLAGDRDASRRFADYWASLDAASRPLLVYNSGRLIEDILAFITEEGLPDADYLIGGVGTMMHAATVPEIADAYAASLDRDYDPLRIAERLRSLPGIRRQPERYQHALKSSWYFHDAPLERIEALEQELRAEGLSVKLVYSSGHDLDVLPGNADKGKALTWLCAKLGIGLDEAVVAGDTGNDLGMFLLDGVRGIVPANAHPELRRLAGEREDVYLAERDTADGIIEGLRHWQAREHA
ncbi:MAG TPA: HAD-IIB family hydrolase [Rhizobium sp.]|nr:HAD-IIB family hydrolase [Rhizobium sp.]